MNIKDIAKLAGVGVSTVSRVINNHPDVKDETRESILKIIKEHKYIPNSSARVLKKSSTKNIGVLVKGVFNPFFSEMISVIGGKINESGYSMLLEYNDYNSIEDIGALTSFIKEKKLQGVVCLGGNYMEVSEESLESIDVPVVLTSVNSTPEKMKRQYSSIGIDNVMASKEVVDYLVKKGHKKIAIMLGEKNDIGISWWRFKGYRDSLLQNNIEIEDDLVLIGNYNSEDAYETTREFLKSKNDITAIFSISDIMAIGAAKAILEASLEVGKDIAIVGFDGLDMSKFYNPGITTVVQPKADMARKSIELLLSLIKDKAENQHIIMGTELVERESSSITRGDRVNESI